MTMVRKIIVTILFIQMFASAIAFAHPGSGIVVDKYGQVYLTCSRFSLDDY
jgi:hypothetical protein